MTTKVTRDEAENALKIIADPATVEMNPDTQPTKNMWTGSVEYRGLSVEFGVNTTTGAISVVPTVLGTRDISEKKYSVLKDDSNGQTVHRTSCDDVQDNPSNFKNFGEYESPGEAMETAYKKYGKETDSCYKCMPLF